MTAPLIITPGDPSGIGPEIALKALLGDDALRANCVLMGEVSHLRNVAVSCGVEPRFHSWTPGAPLLSGAINLLEVAWPAPVIAGQPNPKNAPLIIHAIEMAASLALQGHISGIVTCPIAKSNLYEAGFSYPGHTEYLGALSGDKTAIMMLANKALRVVPATIHIPLSKVGESLTKQGLCDLIISITQALWLDFGIAKPKIAICGLNPHAGENGTIGTEETETIIPAIEMAENKIGDKAQITGPLAADSLFHAEKLAAFDCVVGMYHDQALIPVKTIDFHGSVNITLGLDFVRTSPDHGTAFDIAGKNLARPDSLINALYFAQDMARNRRALASSE